MKKIGEYDFVKRYIGSNEVKYIYVGNNLIYLSEEIPEVLPYDTQIEYLESTGAQLINTNISGGSDCEYSIMFLISSSGNSTYNHLYGSSRPAEAPKLYRYQSNGRWYYEYGSASYEILPSNDYNIHTIEFKSGSIYLDNVLKRQVGTYGFGNNYFCLFGYLEEPELKAYAKIYSCKIWKDGQLVRDLIPVRVGQTGYMYDRISKQLFNNKGTGDFVLGPDIILPLSEFLKLEYLESTGAAYINTEVYNNDSVIIDMKMSATGEDKLNGSEPNSSSRYKWGTNGDGYIYYGFDYNHTSSAYATLNDTYTFHLLLSQLYVKDSNENIILSSSERVSSFAAQPLILFRFFSENLLKGNESGAIRIYYCNILTSTRNLLLIPVLRKSDNVLGLYDLISDIFLTNSGSGSFTAGPNIND